MKERFGYDQGKRKAIAVLSIIQCVLLLIEFLVIYFIIIPNYDFLPGKLGIVITIIWGLYAVFDVFQILCMLIAYNNYPKSYFEIKDDGISGFGFDKILHIDDGKYFDLSFSEIKTVRVFKNLNFNRAFTYFNSKTYYNLTINTSVGMLNFCVEDAEKIGKMLSEKNVSVYILETNASENKNTDINSNSENTACFCKNCGWKGNIESFCPMCGSRKE